MYEAFFDLQKRPFPAAPDPECFVPVGDAESALTDLEQCVRESRGIGVVTSAAGLGKTLVCRVLARELESEFAVAWLPNGSYPSRRALLQAILFELGHPYARLSESEMRLALASAAREARPELRGVLILIDEAHLLGEKLLEELRGLTNHQADGQPLFAVVLSGSLELDERLAAPSCEAIRQRIGCQTTLQPLTQGDAAAYLAERIAWAGGRIETVFTDEAVRLIAHASDGSPRCLNQLADQSMLLASASDQRPVEAELVRQALEDLRELPLHWNTPARIEPRVGSVDDPAAAESTDEDEREDAAELAEASVERADSTSERSDFAEGVADEGAAAESAASSGLRAADPRRCAAFTLSDDAAECAAIEIGAESCETPNDRAPDAVVELITTSWSERTSAPELFEAQPRDAALADRPRPTPVVTEPPASRPASSETSESHHATARTGMDDDTESSRKAVAGERAPAVPAAAPVTATRPLDASPIPSVPAASSTPSAAPSVRRTEPRRPRRSARGPRGPISWNEEVVVDRYALIDAGKPLTSLMETTADVFGSLDDSAAPRRPQPDALIDRIIPMIDAALSIDGGRVSTGASGPDEVRRALCQSVGGGGPGDESDSGRDLGRFPGDETDQAASIGASVLEQIQEVRREVAQRLGSEERAEADPPLRAMTEEELVAEPPLDAPASEPPVDVTAPSVDRASAWEGSSPVRDDAASAEPRTTLPPLSNPPSERRYSFLFSALRKRQKRSA